MEFYAPMPRFSAEKLSIWFAQVESSFTINGIISDQDRYDFVVTNIPMQYTSLVEDIILNPPAEDRYEYLKGEFIKRMSIYQMKNEPMGNKKPSTYLGWLKKMADRRVPNETILNIWMNNLPEKVREIVSIETNRNVEVLVELADKVMKLVNPPPSQVFEVDLSGTQFNTVNRMSELAKQMQVVQMINDGGHQPQQTQPSGLVYLVSYPRYQVQDVRDNNSYKVQRSDNPSLPVCWYHAIYGDRAMACIAPCQYKSTNPYVSYRQ